MALLAGTEREAERQAERVTTSWRLVRTAARAAESLG